MAVMNLSPDEGRALVDIIRVCTEDLRVSMENLYRADRTMGDEHALVVQIKEKFKAYEAMYNNELIPCCKSFNQACEEFTDAAEYIKNFQMDTTVQQVDLGRVESGAYDAAKSL